MQLRLPILDRYMLTELAGPFGFGLSAFTLIFSVTYILAIGRFVSEEHAPLWAAILDFLWKIPGIVALVIPMALLLGTLLAMQRLSGESEINAMKASGITFTRIIAPLLVAGFVMSLVTLVLQEGVVPFASDRATDIENNVIKHVSPFNQDLTDYAPLPGGGRQVTVATAYEPHSQALLHVTLIQYDAQNVPTLIAFADRADFAADEWTLENVSSYRFEPTGDVMAAPKQPSMVVTLGENPADIVKRISNGDPQMMSRAEIADIIRTNQLTEGELRKYISIYEEKLAQPFAGFVFVLIALPFGLRAVRGGGNTSLGFGLAVAIAFIYYIVLTIFSYIGEAFLPFAFVAAWTPNLIFTIIGVARLRKMAAV